MNPRTEALTEEFKQWLDRYSPRRALQSNEKAMGAEINALMRVILKMAPVADYLSWLEKVTTQLDYQMKTSAWPTVSEVGAACSNVNKSRSLSGQRTAVTTIPATTAARRMNAGESVSDGWLYGRDAVALLRTGDVSSDLMRKYRSSLYFSTKKIYGEEKARLMEEGWIARHDAAERLDRVAASRPDGEPFNRMPTSPEDEFAA